MKGGDGIGRIYKITNHINGKVYIGQTSLPSVYDRFKVHLKNASKHINRYLYDAMNHYNNKNFSIVEIEHCDDSLLDEREIAWIDYYGSNIKQYGYNMTRGGGGGDTWTLNPHKEQTIEKSKQTKIKNGTYGKATPKGTTSANRGKSTVNPKVKREGVVIRNPKNDFSFKNVSREYLLKHNQ